MSEYLGLGRRDGQFVGEGGRDRDEESIGVGGID